MFVLNLLQMHLLKANILKWMSKNSIREEMNEASEIYGVASARSHWRNCFILIQHFLFLLTLDDFLKVRFFRVAALVDSSIRQSEKFSVYSVVSWCLETTYGRKMLKFMIQVGALWQISISCCHHKIMFIGEAHFWLNRHVNKQSWRIRSDGQPQVMQELPMYSEKMTVWWCLYADGGHRSFVLLKNDCGKVVEGWIRWTASLELVLRVGRQDHAI